MAFGVVDTEQEEVPEEGAIPSLFKEEGFGG